MSAWPSSLPTYSLQSDHGEDTQDGRVRTEMDAGPPKMRRRFTAVAARFSWGQILTREQVAELETFFLDTLVCGTLAFDWVHPRTTLPVSARFVSRPSYSRRSGLYYATFAVEVLP